MDLHEIDAPDFWDYLDNLVSECELVIDRPRGSIHPEYPDLEYPLDYGYLDGTTTIDGGGIDAFVGSRPDRKLEAIALTVDLKKRDAEIKLLLGCTLEEQRIIQEFHNGFMTRAHLLQRGGELAWLRSRRSVRQFQDRKVPDSLLARILETATLAPSAHNRQPWRFAVVQSREAREKMASTMGADFRRDLLADGVPAAEVEAQTARSFERISNAPVAVVICLDPGLGDEYPDPDRKQAEYLMGVQGVTLAGCYLLLAAHAAGLAGVWMCAPLFAPLSLHHSLDLPQEWQPQALILLGYPARIPPQRQRKPIKDIAIFL
jgi:F420 biosynthesis protein FbiB-like protein